ncbi:MAG: DUF1929 domain-containing protein [Frankia sp.]|nr:DUF1929 domain-containing protein [Frankia sp.]
MRKLLVTTLSLALVGSASPALTTARAASDDPALVGSFSAPFQERGARCVKGKEGGTVCLPAAATAVVLPTKATLYWDALAGIQNTEYSAVAEFGDNARNDVSRVLELGAKPSWRVPRPPDGGANQAGNQNEYLPGVTHSDPNGGQGDLFCSDQVHLVDGRTLDAGGTSYYLEPYGPGTAYGVTELEGLKSTRSYSPTENRWRQLKPMAYARWYPSLVTLPSGKVFVASGVSKLIKPFYADRPADSGRNVVQTETFDPRTSSWSKNPASADRSLPLAPRLHLLPNGQVFYDAAGQTFNPAGEAYDEPLWNNTAVYDPKTQRWTDLGVADVGVPGIGFRGSSFSVALPIKAPYTSASFVSAGGVFGMTPGAYLANATSTLNTVHTGGGVRFETQRTGPLHNARWYSSGVGLPTGEVLAVSGADRDEVVGPGSGAPVLQAELFDPRTRTWRALATAHRGRTYHNTAVLLPDGRVLVGGHAPIDTLYSRPTQLPGMSDPARDPSFEVFSPPYLFRGKRPVITRVAPSVRYARGLRIAVTDSTNIDSVVLVRNPAVTHLIDGDQRTVELPILRRDARSVTVMAPPSGNVAPPGPYLLFVNKWTKRGPTPSVARQVYVGTPVPPAQAMSLALRTASEVQAELAALRG